MARTNRNVTLQELQAALIASGGSRSIAATDLNVSLAWVFSLVRAFEKQGATFAKSKKKKPVKRTGEVYKPTRKEIRAACKAIQAGWSNRERMMRRVSKLERLEVTRVEFHDDSRDMIW